MPFRYLGIYGIGAIIFGFAGAIVGLGKPKQRIALLLLVTLLVWILSGLPRKNAGSGVSVNVAGIQLEFPPELELPRYLDLVLERYSNTQIAVLSEYTLDSAPSERLRNWCRENRRYLVVGGKKDSAGTSDFYNTAFVIDPNGDIVFEQVKSVPIQFFHDGLPARSQEVWNSPWGKIGICVCYDLSYRNVIDRFIEQGAQAMIVPFMDIQDWGFEQHEQHARVGPIRAAEYGIPLFRLGSSGISQIIAATGEVVSDAPFPGQQRVIGGSLVLPEKARTPVDHWAAPISVAASITFVLFGLLRASAAKSSR